MDKRISIKNCETYQLVSLGIELTHRIMSIKDCAPDLLQSNMHILKAHELALKWNELFFELFVPNRTLGINKKVYDSYKGNE